jgi:hypothetical protein
MTRMELASLLVVVRVGQSGHEIRATGVQRAITINYEKKKEGHENPVTDEINFEYVLAVQWVKAKTIF